MSKGNLFYSIYGLLHSPDYRSRCADNLGKELLRSPGGPVEEVLAPVSSHAPTVAERRYRVTKMKFAKTKDASGKTTGICNDFITLKNILLRDFHTFPALR